MVWLAPLPLGEGLCFFSGSETAKMFSSTGFLATSTYKNK